MTREQLIRKRKKKKRIRYALIAGAGIAALLLIIFAVRFIAGRPKKRKAAEETAAAQEVTADPSDTAGTIALSAGMSGVTGWNMDSAGWWYLNEDETLFANGWKTIDGQKYYFTGDGHVATGWVNTGKLKDTYFDASGRIDTSKYQKLVALTYDDGPTKKYTPSVLDAFEKHGQKATFFVVGEMAEQFPEIIQREKELGMEIGSHTYDHPYLTNLTAQEIADEMDKNDEVIRGITGETMEIMRPTGGGVNTTVLNTIQKPMIQWDVDTLDWDHRDDQKTFDAIMDGVQDGSIVLMHDLHPPSANIADRLITKLNEMGYKCVTVSELAEAYGYDLEPAGEYFALYPGGNDRNRTLEEALEAYGRNEESSDDSYDDSSDDSDEE
ncbi:MAG: polysaccharide deacetylase family protein [Lachnospiraceae bacterium]|nr:polysaccharide deacetylase family protein [Lachnospiraceae bacterium]